MQMEHGRSISLKSEDIDGNTEIDVMALDSEENNMIVGECKYWNRPIGTSVLESLEEKATHVSWNRDNRKVWYVLLARVDSQINYKN